ncbi:MAG TPA: hypothetical protein ENI62_05185 [Gammaproteobacteria bacterium]|nr:hypothetical protein [Gammaproteobacteria bacterium]
MGLVAIRRSGLLIIFALLLGWWMPQRVIAQNGTTSTTNSVDNSEIQPLAVAALLLQVSRAGQRLIAVGDFGDLLLSDDSGKHWRQIVVPTRALLVRAFFINAQEGWVVGHDAVILHTTDGGEHWSLQYADPKGNTPLFDIYFSDDQHGLAVGAYGSCLRTADGGTHWQQCTVNAEEDYHLNRLIVTTAGLFIAAEAGRIYRSQDQGAHWQAIDSGYQGSLFGILELANHDMLAYGLRGHVLFSTDAGASWQPRKTAVLATLMDAVQLPGGSIVISGTAGTLLISSDQGKTFRIREQPNRAAILSLLPLPNQGLLLAGEHGVSVIQAMQP